MKQIERVYRNRPQAESDILDWIVKAKERKQYEDVLPIVENLVSNQKRDAIIEVALEKVRTKTLDMRRSEQLAETAEVLFSQVHLLGPIPDRMSIGIFEESLNRVRLWVTDQQGNQLNHEFFFSLDEPTSMAKIHQAWKEKKEEVVIDLIDQELYDWLRFVKESARLPIDETKINGRRVQQAVFFSSGFLLLTTHQPVSAEMMKLMGRFARVFDVTYARFIDLQVAEAQTREALLARDQVESTLLTLRETQAQLIHAEKMASMGELTSGIAHEIQNPLNFVNNFSEINEMLAGEIREAIGKSDLQEAQSLVNMMEKNEQKIHYHGRRAEAIVKIMMQHARRSTGKKIPSDINELAEEALQIAYTNIRSRDGSFRTMLKTEFESEIAKIPVVPEDISLVFLNLLHNAFYSLHEKKEKAEKEFLAMILVKTQKKGDKIEISIQDNGSGIADNIMDKIFQPFFTTKPAGIGIGLGLSLSYDIIKMHGGKISVSSELNKGAQFVISLPMVA